MRDPYLEQASQVRSGQVCCICLDGEEEEDGKEKEKGEGEQDRRCDDQSINGTCRTDCGHFYHTRCLMKHVQSGGRDCPMCRRELVEREAKDMLSTVLEVSFQDPEQVREDARRRRNYAARRRRAERADPDFMAVSRKLKEEEGTLRCLIRKKDRMYAAAMKELEREEAFKALCSEVRRCRGRKARARRRFDSMAFDRLGEPPVDEIARATTIFMPVGER